MNQANGCPIEYLPCYPATYRKDLESDTEEVEALRLFIFLCIPYL